MPCAEVSFTRVMWVHYTYIQKGPSSALSSDTFGEGGEPMSNEESLRSYSVRSRSTDLFGRVLCSARNHHFVADGPIQNGCPGEEITPAELFLSGIASCAVELIQALARRDGVALAGIGTTVDGVIDLDDQQHPDHTLFNRIRMRVDIQGVSDDHARRLVDGFKGR